jgi:hypothetical protein
MNLWFSQVHASSLRSFWCALYAMSYSCFASGAKARIFWAFSARLKSCPVTFCISQSIFHSLSKKRALQGDSNCQRANSIAAWAGVRQLIFQRIRQSSLAPPPNKPTPGLSWTRLLGVLPAVSDALATAQVNMDRSENQAKHEGDEVFYFSSFAVAPRT